jgi:WD repeat-containing protein 76
MTATELSEYERQRQANIAERDALLKKLALDAANAGIVPKAKSAPIASKPAKKKAPVKKVKEEIVPRRTSSRLAGIEADSEKAKRKAEEEYEAVQEAARIKRQRVSGDLNLGDIVVNGKEWNKENNVFIDVINRGANPYERTFGETEVRATSNKELKALREKMSGLEIYDGFEPSRELFHLKKTPCAMLIYYRNKNHTRKNLCHGFPSRA